MVKKDSSRVSERCVSFDSRGTLSTFCVYRQNVDVLFGGHICLFPRRLDYGNGDQMNIEELRTQTKRFFDFDPVFAYPAKTVHDEIIAITDCEPKLILGMAICKGKIVVFMKRRNLYLLLSV